MTAQRTGIAGLSGNGWSFTYENDGAPFSIGIVGKEKWSTSNTTGFTDGNRTAAATITVGDFSIGVRLYTGNRDFKQDKPEPLPGYPNGRVTNAEASQYLSGVFYASYKNFRVGVDHYLVGHYAQNILAHTWIKKQEYFPWLDAPNRPNKLYGGYISTNPNTNW